MENFSTNKQICIFQDIIRDFDFEGEFVTMKGINNTIIKAAWSIIVNEIMPFFILEPLCNNYDSITYSILA